MFEKKTVGIVTVLYNSRKMLSDFFESLDKQSYKDFILYVIDNKSTDDSLNLARKLAMSVGFTVILIENKENLGVAEGNNIGIKAAIKDRCEYILLSNNDICFSENIIGQMVSKLLESSSELLVPKIYFYDEPHFVWYAGGEFNSFCRPIHYGYMKEDNQVSQLEQEVSYAPTCFMLIKSSVFEEVGLMDEHYFVYYDDTDFAWRAMVLHKKKLLYYPSIYIYHKEGASTGGNKSDFSLYYQSRNQVYFALKNLSFFQKVLYFSYEIVRVLFKEIPILCNSQRKLLLNAVRDGIKMHQTVK